MPRIYLPVPLSCTAIRISHPFEEKGWVVGFFSPRIQVLLRVFTQPQGGGGRRRSNDGLPTPPLGPPPGPTGPPPRPPGGGERAESAGSDWLRPRVGGARRSGPIKVRWRACLGFASACMLQSSFFCLEGASLAVRAGAPFPRVMATKAVCVLKGDGPVQGTIHFEAKARAGGGEGEDQRRGRARQPVPWSGRPAPPALGPPSPRLPPPARGSAGPRSTPTPGPPPARARPQSAESPGEPGGGAWRGLGGGAGREHRPAPLCVCGGGEADSRWPGRAERKRGRRRTGCRGAPPASAGPDGDLPCLEEAVWPPPPPSSRRGQCLGPDILGIILELRSLEAWPVLEVPGAAGCGRALGTLVASVIPWGFLCGSSSGVCKPRARSVPGLVFVQPSS